MHVFSLAIKFRGDMPFLSMKSKTIGFHFIFSNIAPPNLYDELPLVMMQCKGPAPLVFPFWVRILTSFSITSLLIQSSTHTRKSLSGQIYKLQWSKHINSCGLSLRYYTINHKTNVLFFFMTTLWNVIAKGPSRIIGTHNSNNAVPIILEALYTI